MMKDDFEKTILRSKFIFGNQEMSNHRNLFNEKTEKLNIYVLRNHGFEIIQKTNDELSLIAGYQVNWQIGSYDDGLYFEFNNEAELDFILVWYDRTRNSLNSEDFIKWMHGKLNEFSKFAKVIFAPIGLSLHEKNGLIDFTSSKSNLIFVDLCLTKTADERDFQLSGTRISPNDYEHAFQSILLQGLVNSNTPDIRAIFIDLDNTLYTGILGEDSLNDLKMTSAQLDMQNELIKLSMKGFPLIIVSKNEIDDVDKLLEFGILPLTKNNFFSVEANWQEKFLAIVKNIKKLNLSPSNCLYIDDNPAEVAKVLDQVPGINVVVYQTQEDEKFYFNNIPGLKTYNISDKNLFRLEDIKSNQERNEILASEEISLAEYLARTESTLTFSINRREHFNRAVELFQKTNQFNISLSRTSRESLETTLLNPTSILLTIEATDIFSKSGIIGAVLAQDDEILEAVISCRALNRGLENHILLRCVAEICLFNNIEAIRFLEKNGPRNMPALEWFKSVKTNTDLLTKDFADSFLANLEWPRIIWNKG